jgi:DNA polymerase-3 subunit delta
MHANELLDQIGKKPLPPVLLFAPGAAPFGKEPWEPALAERAIERIIATHVDPGMRDLCLSSFHADECKPGEIVMEAQTLPFLVERRVLIVRSASRYNAMSGEKGSPLAPLIAYLEAPSDTTLLILIADNVDKRKKFYKACQKGGAIVECPQLDDRALTTWIRSEVQNRGKDIDGGAINELIHRGGSRLGDINNAINLVTTYAGDAPRVTQDDVVAACADVAEETVWALTDAIAASNPDKALSTLFQLEDLGKSPDEIMGLINWLLDSAYRAMPETQATIKSSFQANKVMPLANKLGLEKLKRAFALCTETHLAIRSTGTDQMLALELLVIKLSAPRGGGKRPASRA